MRFAYPQSLLNTIDTDESASTFNQPQVLPTINIVGQKKPVNMNVKAYAMSAIAIVVSLITMIAAIKILRSKKL